VTNEWLFHNKGILNWWFTDKWGEEIRDTLKARLRNIAWVAPLQKQMQDEFMKVDAKKPLRPIRKHLIHHEYNRSNIVELAKEDYLPWFDENVKIGEAKKTGLYNRAAQFDAPIYEITITLPRYDWNRWSRLWNQPSLFRDLRITEEWFFLMNMHTILHLPLSEDETLSARYREILRSVEEKILLTEPITPFVEYFDLARVGTHKNIVYQATLERKGVPSGTQILEWTLRITPKTGQNYTSGVEE
tara:strand:+ start:911 stop:1645 length:735 start_codon:yes stop_codon:yes gene_type:complete